MQTIKPLSQSVSLTTANTVSNSTLVYLAANSNTLITITSNTGTVTGSFVIPQTTYIVVEKKPTDTIAANVAIAATSVARGY